MNFRKVKFVPALLMHTSRLLWAQFVIMFKNRHESVGQLTHNLRNISLDFDDVSLQTCRVAELGLTFSRMACFM